MTESKTETPTINNDNDNDNDNDSEDPGYWDRVKITSTLLNIPDSDLGKLLRNYLMDSIHNNWDAHPEDFVSAYYELFTDMIVSERQYRAVAATPTTNVTPTADAMMNSYVKFLDGK